MLMLNNILLYISAAPDLQPEREILGRAVAEMPVDLGWHIVQSPLRDDPVATDAVAAADVHLLLLGSDIRAPVGLEWQVARRAGRWPATFLKQDILRTPAAQEFVRFVEGPLPLGAGAGFWWRPFKDTADLRRQVLGLLARFLLDRADVYTLSPLERARLEDRRSELETAAPEGDNEVRGGAGESGILLSHQRYVPSEGVLIQPDGVDSP